MELVTKLNEARYVTHNGTMHADEVFATAFLDLYRGNIKVIRVSEVQTDKLQPDTIVYDIGRGKFDHHGQDAEVRENGIKYSSFGLLFREFGKDFLNNRNIEDIEEAYTMIEKELKIKVNRNFRKDVQENHRQYKIIPII